MPEVSEFIALQRWESEGGALPMRSAPPAAATAFESRAATEAGHRHGAAA